MNRPIRKLLAWTLALIMLIGMMPVDAMAAIIKTDTSSAVKIGDIVPMRIIHPVSPTHTYIFVVDGGTSPSPQIVKNNEKLIEPAAPVKENHKFTGWTGQDEEGNSVSIVFGQEIPVTGNQTITVTAQFEPVVYVFFNHNGQVIFTKETAPGGTVDSTGVPLVVTDTGKAFKHWSANPNQDVNEPFNFDAQLQANTNLYAILTDSWKITYDSHGGTFVLPAYVIDGGSLPSPEPEPTRAGYAFLHWSDTPDGPEYAGIVTSDMTLHAVWQKNDNTRFTIIYWIENADDNNYSYENSRERTGETERQIVLQNNLAGYSTANIDAAYRDYFTYSHYDTGKTIAGDGSTIVNVYFNRISYNLWFYENNVLKHTITAKYGQYIADKFPIPGYSGRAWRSRNTTLYPYALQTLDRMPGQNVNFDLYRKNSNTLKTIKYYTQNITGNNYTLLKTVETYFNYITYEEEYHPIQGFDRQSASDAGFNSWYQKDFTNNNVDLYYLRKSYNLVFRNVNTDAKTESVRYQAPLAAYYNYVPPKPNDVPENYLFKGWFTTPAGEAGTEAAAKLTTMPAGNAIVYAKWSPPEYPATIHRDPGGGDSYIIQIPHGATINEADLEKNTPEGFTEADFLGWFWYGAGPFVKFDFSMPVYQPVELFPVWKDLKFNVSYDLNNGSGTPPSDSRDYLQGAHADVLDLPSDVTGPDNKVFLGWLHNGTLYQPGDKVRIEGDVELIAQWGPAPQQTKVIYKPGTGTGEDYTVSNLPNNGTHVVLGIGTDTGQVNFSKSGYLFTGWKATNGTVYQPGATVMLDTDNEGTENIFEAQWVNNLTDVTATKKWVGGHAANHVSVTLVLSRTVNNLPDNSFIPPAATIDPPSGTSNVFVYTWKDLEIADSNFNHYIYQVAEQNVPNVYTSNVEQDEANPYNFTVTNTYNNFKPLTSHKYWYFTGTLNPNEYPRIWFALYRYTNDINEAELVDINSWNQGNDSHTWPNVVNEAPDGTAYNFYVQEVYVQGNTVTNPDYVPPGWQKYDPKTGTDAMNVHNYKGAFKRDVSVTKDWGSVPEYLRKEVTVKLLQDGVVVGSSKTLNTDNNWSAVWTDLPNYKNSTTK